MAEHRIEFTASENPWSPTAAVAEINVRTGSGLELIGLADQTGGTSSAAYVRWPDGRECALTRTDLPLDRMRQTAGVLSKARSDGLLVPRHDLVMELADGRLAVVQERLPGAPPGVVGASTIDAMVAANEQFAGLLANRPGVPTLSFHLRPDSAEGRQWHRTLGAYSDRCRALLERIRDVGRSEPHEMAGDDLVHPDYGLGNVLFDESGHVTGVIDWNWGAWRGDRWFALLKLSINIWNEGDQYGIQRDGIDRLDHILRSRIEPDVLRMYWAGWTLRNVYTAIDRRFSRQRVDDAIRLGEYRLA